MDSLVGSILARVEQPATPKFAFPLLVLPELFTTPNHLAFLTGYLTSLGWEVITLDLYTDGPPREDFHELFERVQGARVALDREVIALGHGFGGLAALRLAEGAGVRAAAALAPLVPGVKPLLMGGLRNRIAALSGGSLRPPSGRRLFELIADADPFARDLIIKQLRPSPSTLMRGVVADEVKIGAGAPRLIVSGDSDVFAPRPAVEKLAARSGAELSILTGRGHWLIGGRALAPAVGEFQRFIVRALGAELLLLYSDESK